MVASSIAVFLMKRRDQKNGVSSSSYKCPCRIQWFRLPSLHVTPQQMDAFVSVAHVIFVRQVSERLAPVQTHLCIEFSLQTPQKMSSPLCHGPRCPPLCCNWEQLCAEVTIVHTERFLEEGPGCVQSTLYPRAECRRATVPTGRSVQRAAQIYSRCLLHTLYSFNAPGTDSLLVQSHVTFSAGERWDKNKVELDFCLLV